MRIPFDSFVLSAVTAELKGLVPAKIQGIRQPQDDTLVIGLYAGGRESMLLLSCHPVFSRAHLTTRRPANRPSPSAFLSTLRTRLDGGRLVQVRQVQGDRMLDLTIESDSGIHRLVAELMGKHSNLILVDGGGRIVSAAKWVGTTKSSRPILPSREYHLPPVMKGGEELKPSPFYQKLATGLGELPRPDHPVLSPSHGAYPCSVAVLGFQEFARPSISIALEQHFQSAIPQAELESLRNQLLSQLDRVLLARDTALSDLRAADAAGGKAPEWQRIGELILAYGPSAEPGADHLVVWDYDGTQKAIPYDPESSFQENAARFFDRAKRAKSRLGTVREQIVRLANDRDIVAGFRLKVEQEDRLDRLSDLREELLRRRYLNPPPVAAIKEERPYEGHRIRELTGPGSWTVLYGENAEANDYLTLRVAKPNDWWLHVRGGTSAHVVIVTRNQPDRVQPETLRYAAKVAVQNSPSKHAGYVSVDYTLKKYVRKPKGAARGTALYTHEKTLHVES